MPIGDSSRSVVMTDDDGYSTSSSEHGDHETARTSPAPSADGGEGALPVKSAGFDAQTVTMVPGTSGTAGSGIDAHPTSTGTLPLGGVLRAGFGTLRAEPPGVQADSTPAASGDAPCPRGSGEEATVAGTDSVPATGAQGEGVEDPEANASGS